MWDDTRSRDAQLTSVSPFRGDISEAVTDIHVQYETVYQRFIKTVLRQTNRIRQTDILFGKDTYITDNLHNQEKSIIYSKVEDSSSNPVYASDTDRGTATSSLFCLLQQFSDFIKFMDQDINNQNQMSWLKLENALDTKMAGNSQRETRRLVRQENAMTTICDHIDNLEQKMIKPREGHVCKNTQWFTADVLRLKGMIRELSALSESVGEARREKKVLNELQSMQQKVRSLVPDSSLSYLPAETNVSSQNYFTKVPSSSDLCQLKLMIGPSCDKQEPTTGSFDAAAVGDRSGKVIHSVRSKILHGYYSKSPEETTLLNVEDDKSCDISLSEILVNDAQIPFATENGSSSASATFSMDTQSDLEGDSGFHSRHLSASRSAFEIRTFGDRTNQTTTRPSDKDKGRMTSTMTVNEDFIIPVSQVKAFRGSPLKRRISHNVDCNNGYAWNDEMTIDFNTPMESTSYGERCSQERVQDLPLEQALFCKSQVGGFIRNRSSSASFNMDKAIPKVEELIHPTQVPSKSEERHGNFVYERKYVLDLLCGVEEPTEQEPFHFLDMVCSSLVFLGIHFMMLVNWFGERCVPDKKPVMRYIAVFAFVAALLVLYSNKDYPRPNPESKPAIYEMLGMPSLFATIFQDVPLETYQLSGLMQTSILQYRQQNVPPF